jgi:hypothetical protein
VSNTDPAHAHTADDGAPRRQDGLSGSLERLRALLLAEGGLMASLVEPSPDGLGTDAASAGSAHLGTDVPSAGPAQLGTDVPSAGSEHLGADASSAGPAQLAASGPRVDGRGADYELLVETIYEGYLLHYHDPRVVRPPDRDLGLLAGDRLYALGLARLVELGDIEAVAELADVITLSALAHASDTPELAEAVWIAGACAVGWGASPRHDRAKALVRAGSPDALEALRCLGPA